MINVTVTPAEIVLVIAGLRALADSGVLSESDWQAAVRLTVAIDEQHQRHLARLAEAQVAGVLRRVGIRPRKRRAR